jgi:hypothetical protein
VNRPFSAFGALMALLALSMFAVSSTSRSTTVRPPRSDTANRPLPAAKYVTSLSAACPQCPDQDEVRSDAADDELCPADSMKGGCESIRGCDVFEADEPCASLPGCGSGSCSRLISTRVEPAEKTQATWRFEPTPVDCRSYYDPVYDRLIYGVADEDLQPARTLQRATQDATTIDRDWMAVFKSFIAAERLNRPSSAWSRGSWTTTVLWATLVHRTLAFDLAPSRMRIITRAFRRWLDYQITLINDDVRIATAQAVVPVASALAWAEYAELVDCASRRVFANVSAITTSDDEGSVRSSGWLRHSAASSLYQLGALLQAAGLELEDQASE